VFQMKSRTLGMRFYLGEDKCPEKLHCPCNMSLPLPPSHPPLPPHSQFSEKQLSVFSSSTRLLAERRYAKRGPYLPAKILTTPTILDLSPPRKLTSSDPERTWLSLQFRASVCISAYLAFPYIIKFIMPLVDQSTFELQQVVSSFVPGISILFGTLCSLTANILYQRQARLQQTVSEESAVLAQLTQDFLTLHKVRIDEGEGLERSDSISDIKPLNSSLRSSPLHSLPSSQRPEHTKQRIRAAQVMQSEERSNELAASMLVSKATFAGTSFETHALTNQHCNSHPSTLSLLRFTLLIAGCGRLHGNSCGRLARNGDYAGRNI